MHPEEALVPPLPVSLADGATGVFIEEFTYHRLGDGVDNSRIC